MTHFWSLICSACILINSLIAIPETANAIRLPLSLRIASVSFFEQGIDATEAGDFTVALQAFTQAIDASDRPTAAYANRCLVKIQLEQYESAIDDCTVALNQSPSNLEAYLNRGLAEYRLGRYADAIADNTRLLELQPDDLRAYVNRGLAKAAMKQHQAAIADYTQALKQVSGLNQATLADVYIDKGLSHGALKDFDTAIAHFTQAIQINPDSDRAYFSRGCFYGQQTNYLAAVQDFDRALKLNPHLPEAYLDRAIAHYNLGNSDRALIDLHQAAANFQQQGNDHSYQRVLSLMVQIRRSQQPSSLVG